jgi:hypothetical protein
LLEEIDLLLVERSGDRVEARIIDLSGRVHRTFLLAMGANRIGVGDLLPDCYVLRLNGGAWARFIKE